MPKFELGLWGGFVRCPRAGLDRPPGLLDDAPRNLDRRKNVHRRPDQGRPGHRRVADLFLPFPRGDPGPGRIRRSRTDGPARMDFSWTLPDGSLDERSSAPAGANGRMTSAPPQPQLRRAPCLRPLAARRVGRPDVFFPLASTRIPPSATRSSRTNPVDGRPDLPPVETYDAIAVPLKIPKTSWNSWGANIGAGVRFQAGRLLAFAAEARYFAQPGKDPPLDAANRVLRRNVHVRLSG